MQSEREGRPCTDRAGHKKIAAHAARELAADCQSKPIALARFAFLHNLNERLEHCVESVRWNPSPGIANVNADLIAVARAEYLDGHEALDRAIGGVRREYAEQSVVVDATSLSQTPLYVSGDVAALEQLFSNVVTNAVEASPMGGRGRVSFIGYGAARAYGHRS